VAWGWAAAGGAGGAERGWGGVAAAKGPVGGAPRQRGPKGVGRGGGAAYHT
jgi:hypothetical protein